MRTFASLVVITLISTSCNNDKTETTSSPSPIEGTWELVSGTTIQQSDTTITDYTSGNKMIKIISPTHFAFMLHDRKNGKDSAAVYSSGGGRYTYTGDQYTEFLEYCSAREWEGKEFHFKVTISNDTLTQTGHEKVEESGIDREIMEKYTRVK